MKTIRRAATSLAFTTIIAPYAHGADIYNGFEGPKTLQLDVRGAYAEDNTSDTGRIKDTSGSFRIKWWDSEKEAWAFGVVDSKGNVTLGGGPNFQFETRHGKFGFLSSLGITKGKIKTEAEVDKAYAAIVGSLGSWLSKNKKYGIDASVNYNAGTNNFSAGLLGGRAIGKNVRVAAGVNWNGEEFQPQFSMRVFSTRTKDHVEARFLKTSKGPRIDIYARWNLGKRKK